MKQIDTYPSIPSQKLTYPLKIGRSPKGNKTTRCKKLFGSGSRGPGGSLPFFFFEEIFNFGGCGGWIYTNSSNKYFQVPWKCGRYYVITHLAVYTAYIPAMYSHLGGYCIYYNPYISLPPITRTKIILWILPSLKRTNFRTWKMDGWLEDNLLLSFWEILPVSKKHAKLVSGSL